MRSTASAEAARRAGTRLSGLRRGVAIAAVAGALASACTGPDQAVQVTIARGSFRAAADSLAAAQAISSPLLFRAYARLTGADRRIKPGTYVLRPGMSWGDILADLHAGRGLVRSVTIPEGLPLAQSLPRIAAALAIPVESLEVAAQDPALRARLGVPGETLEGYLFPDTYQIAGDATARSVVELMVRRFEAVWRDDWSARLDTLGIPRHAVLTLASIVEEEARVDSERPVIAGVYWNRLRRGMPLQADPTVRYALGKYTGRVLFRDLEVDSPYNTYRRAGLPPGPIAAPGRASIEAALRPADVPYLYFVAHPDGHHEFTTTFREHSAAIRRVRAEAARRAAAREAARDSASAGAAHDAGRDAARGAGRDSLRAVGT